MTSTADWLVVAGFLLCVLGVALRVVIMMRSSDALPVNAALSGTNQMRTVGARKPKSALPLAMWTSISAGLILLIAGLLLEFR
jgi:hypothetical protein